MSTSVKQSTFVRLGLLAVGLVVLTFLIRGSTRLVLGDRTALLLSAPIGLTALVLLVSLFLVGLLSAIGIRPVEEDLDEG